MEDEKQESKSKRPEDSAFKQQRLKAWQPLLTPRYVIGTFLVIGATFATLGFVILDASNSVVEIRHRYDDVCGNPSSSICTVNIPITKDMDKPVYVYYELSSFYQNHRRYVKSRSDDQLRGELTSSISTCDPIERFNGDIIVPCGLIANSFFNDTFDATLVRESGSSSVLTEAQGTWVKKGIAWQSDIDEKFKHVALTPGTTDRGFGNKTLPRVDDEDFIVWMRTAGLPTFKKLHRKIETIDLKKGDTLTVNITNNFPVSEFDGEKALVLSTTSWLGGKNSFLAIAYIVVGFLCLGMALLFSIKQAVSPRALGDMQYFQWSGAPQVSKEQD